VTDPLPVAPEYVPLASAEDFKEGPFKFLAQGAAPTFLERQMVRASRAVESRCTRRFVPFTGITQSEVAEGIAGDDVGGGGIPMSMLDTLAMSKAQAMGGGNAQVRDFWLDEIPPRNPELWTYSDVTVTVTGPFGSQPVAVAAPQGPSKDTGHVRLPYGTYCPVGSGVVLTYSGGYTVAIPEDLNQACLFTAARLLILQVAPERRGNLTTHDLDEAITDLLAPWARA
jgi:hypothetical protein